MNPPTKKKMQPSRTSQKNLGQFFTIDPTLQDFIFDHVKHRGAQLLEPSFGAGHLLKKFKESDPAYPILAYEIDNTLKPVIEFAAPYQVATYADFTKQAFGQQRFKTIIGNPPYVKGRGKNKPNLYIQFIEICFDLLDPVAGELLFIVPSDFLKLTSAAKLIERMGAAGRFTDFLFPHDERLFEGASIDVVAFRYEKGGGASAPVPASVAVAPASVPTTLNGQLASYTIKNGILTFVGVQTTQTQVQISDLFHVYVGLVSGKDEVYRGGPAATKGGLEVLTDKDRVQKFIFVEEFPTADAEINAYLEAHKPALLARRIRKFGEANWYEWGAPRNKGAMDASIGRPCIYVRNVTRKKDVAFEGVGQYFGGGLLCLIPKAGGTAQPAALIKNVVEYLNSPGWQKDYIYAGRFKIGHKQLSNVMVPLSPPTL